MKRLLAPIGLTVLAVLLGAGVGARLRFSLGETHNRWLLQLPLGAPATNPIGG